jgi:flagellar biosynthesis protein FlhB
VADTSTSEKTEKASAKKLKDARKKGQVVRSRDLVVALTSLALTMVLTTVGGGMMARLGGRLLSGLARIGDRPLAPMNAADITTMVGGDFILVAVIVGPLLATAVVVTLGMNVAQSGWVFAPESLTPDFTKLSPAKGLKRLMPSQSPLDLVKMVIGVTVISVLALHIVREVILDSARVAWMAPADAALDGWSRLRSLLWLSGLWLAGLAGADFGLQYWRQRSSLKMTKQEVRDEGKSSEGSPEVKARVRKVQREMSRRRMLAAVKTATVVVTNPTHFAVALRYHRDTMAAPIVVAKGRDLMAERIKKVARENSVPTVENVSLAQALYKGAEIGDAIPGALFGAVAEVLAYLVRIKQLMM